MTAQSPTNDAGKLAYTVPDACRALSISQSHFWKLARLGKLRTLKIAGRTLIAAKEIERILTEGVR